jgi:TolA-binding protein
MSEDFETARDHDENPCELVRQIKFRISVLFGTMAVFLLSVGFSATRSEMAVREARESVKVSQENANTSTKLLTNQVWVIETLKRLERKLEKMEK